MKLRKMLTIAISAAMIVTCFASVPAMAKSSKKGPALIKSYTYSDYNTDAKRWEKSSLTKYTYKKAYPAVIESAYYNSNNLNRTIYKYKVKGSKAKSMKAYNPVGRNTARASYKKGLRSSFSSWSSDKTSKTSYKLKYNKKGFVTSYVYVDTYKGWEYDDNNAKKNYTSKETSTHNYKITMKKGLPSKISGTYSEVFVRTPGSTNKYDNNRTYISTFNKAGIVTKAGYTDNETNKYRDRFKFKVTLKKGKVTRIIREYNVGTEEAVKWEKDGKYDFKYDKTKISKQRYANMINDIVFGYSDYAYFSWF